MKGKILKLFAFGLVLVLLLSGMQAGMPATVQAKDDSDYELVAVWHFDEGSGTVAKDASGHRNDGTIHGATWTTGISGKALRFDGADDYVEVFNDLTLNFGTGDFTYELWFKANTIPPSDAYQLLCKRVDGNYEVQLQSNGFVLTYFGDSSDRDIIESSSVVSTGVWYHVAVVRQSSMGYLYVNSVQEGSVATSHNVDNSNPLNLGRDVKLQSEYFDGQIDEIAIYSRALTPEEIEAHYLAKRAGGSAEDSASNLIKSVSSRIDVLKRNNVDTSLIEEALKNAQNAYDLEKYDESCELAQSALKMADNAYEAVQHIESAQSEIDDAKSIGADVKDAEKKLKEARDALNKGNYEYAEDWADDALQLAKHASVGSVSIKELKALATKYDERTVAISGTIRDIETVYGEGYRFAIDDGSGMISVVYQGSLGDINDGDKVKASGVFQASVGTVVADNVRESSDIPGFEAIFAIAGLLVVAYILRRKRS
jgi:PGF-CTERM protein